MKIIAIFGLLIVNPTLLANDCQLDQLKFLQGQWLDNSGKNLVSESWNQVSSKTLEGFGQVKTKHGEIRNQEALIITEMDGQLFYIAKPKQNQLATAFVLISCNDNRLIFVNEQHDFPQRIIYQYHAATKTTDEFINVDVHNNQGQGFNLKFHRPNLKAIKN